MSIRTSTRIIERLAPRCARPDIPAFGIERPGSDTAEASFHALGIDHAVVPRALCDAWLPGVHVPEGSSVFMTRDTTLDLSLAMYQLGLEAERQGVQFVPANAIRLRTDGQRVARVQLEDHSLVPVHPRDSVVLAAGAGIRPLLMRSGLAVPGLRQFQSVLAAAPSSIGNRLVAVLCGGVNVLPHYLRDGRLLSVFGNSRRVEVHDRSDACRLQLDPAQVELLYRDVADQLGIDIDRGTSFAWAGLKTEVVPPDGTHSQAAHTHLVPSVDNLWMAIPGKLSQSASAADELARHLCRKLFGVEVAHPVWEGESARWASTG